MSNTPIDTRFLDALAGPEPTPGGGSAASLAGAIAAGLVSMVCNLTRGQKRFEAVRADVERCLVESEELRARLTSLTEEDMAAYSGFAEAQRLPRASDEEKQRRSRAMQEALRQCTLVPLRTAQACREVLWLCPEVREKGNPAAVSDVGVAALLAEAALRGAALQVLVNLSWLKDDQFIALQRQHLDAVLRDTAETKERVVAAVERALQGK